MTQTRLSYKRYGYKSEDDFLGAFPQYFYAASVYKGKITYGGNLNNFVNKKGISNNANTNAVAKLVNGQRNASKSSNIIQKPIYVHLLNYYFYNFEEFYFTKFKYINDTSKVCYKLLI